MPDALNPVTPVTGGALVDTDNPLPVTIVGGGLGLTVGTTTITGGTNGRFLFDDNGKLGEVAGGVGTVTKVSVTTANGVSGTVADDTTTPAISLALGDITPTTVNKVTLTAPATGSTLTIVDGATLTASATATVSGTNTGDQTTVSGNAGTATKLATARAIYGNDFDGSAALTQVIASTFGGTGNGFTKFSGPTTAERTFTLPDANATLVTTATTSLTSLVEVGTLTAGALGTGFTAVGVAQGGTGAATLAAHGVLIGNATGAVAVSGAGTAGQVFTSNGASADPTFQAAAGAAYALAATNTISGTPASVVFTGLTAEDIIIDLRALAVTAGTASFRVEFSTDNGSSYYGTVFVLSNGQLSTTGLNMFFPIAGLKVGMVEIPYGNIGGGSTSALPQTVSAGMGAPTPYLIMFGDNVDAIRVTPSASTFVNGGVINIWGRG